MDNVLVTAVKEETGAEKLLIMAEEALALTQGDYTDKSFEALRSAAAHAKEAAENPDVTADDVAAETAALKYALATLKTKPVEAVDGIEKVHYPMDGSNQSGWWGPVEAVSYTHLDVYKRQF